MERTPTQSQNDKVHDTLETVRIFVRMNGDRYSNLIPLAHEPIDIANALGLNATRRGPLTAIQEEGLSDLRNMTPFDPRTQDPGDANLIKKWFEVFDKMFFSRSLEKYCNVRIVNANHSGIHGECRPEHMSSGLFNYTPDDVKFTIFIYLRQEDPSDSVLRLDLYLKTLIHEMIHAVLDIYSCHCRLNCYEKTRFWIGYTGHGCAWLHILANLHKAIPQLLGRDLGIGGVAERHLAMEIMARNREHNYSLTPNKVAEWTLEVSNLLGISRHHLLQMWGLSLAVIDEDFRAEWRNGPGIM